MPNTPLIIRALRREKTERPPVWIMRQAGRYMAEYRAMKEKHSFLELCRTPELALEITMQPMHFLNPDAAILFSDIMIPLEGLGFEIDFKPGPVVANKIKTPADVSALKSYDVWSGCKFVFDALRLIRGELSLTHPNAGLLGFAGAPWTMACYVIEQGLFKHFQGTEVFAKAQPKAFAELIDKFTSVVTDYLLAQVEAGAQAVQLFDSWGGNLTAEEYKRYSLPSIQKISAAIKKTGTPVILYVGNTGAVLETLKDAGVDCVSLDARVDLVQAREVLGPNVALQGNLSPTDLFLPQETVVKTTQIMLESMRGQAGYIANLGHGILPTTPPENARAFVETIKKFR